MTDPIDEIGASPPPSLPLSEDSTLPSPSTKAGGLGPKAVSPIPPNKEDDTLEYVQTLFDGSLNRGISLDHYERAYHSYVGNVAGTTKLEFRNLVNFIDAHTLDTLPIGPARSALIEAKLALDELTKPGIQLSQEHQERLVEMQLLGKVGLVGASAVKPLAETGAENFQRVLELTSGTTGVETSGPEALASGFGVAAAAPTLLIGFAQCYLAFQGSAHNELKKEAAQSIYIGSTRFSTEMISLCAKASATTVGAVAGFKVLLGAGLVVAGVKTAQESIHKIHSAEKEIETLNQMPLEGKSSAFTTFVGLRSRNLQRQLYRDGWFSVLAGAAAILAGAANIAAGVMGIVAVAAGAALAATPVGWILIGSLAAGLLVGCIILYLHPAKWDSIKKAFVEHQLNKLTKEIDAAHLQDPSKLEELHTKRTGLEKELQELNSTILREKAGDPVLYEDLTKNLDPNLHREEFTPFIGDTTGLDEEAFKKKVLEAVVAPVS